MTTFNLKNPHMNALKPNLSAIAAITRKDQAIGSAGKLLVAISDDLKRFKTLTTGHAIVMGRKTYESIGRLLPNRKNFIVTKNTSLNIPDAVMCHDLEQAIEKAWMHELASPNEKKEIFLIGGGEIYKQGLPFTNKLYLTIIEENLTGDVFFPDFSDFKKVLSKEDRVDAKTNLKYQWIDLER